MKKKLNSEVGQGLVEFALVLPIFVVLVMFIMDCAWVGFQRISFDYACREATWGSDLNSYEVKSNNAMYKSGDDVDKSICKELLKQAPQLKEKNLKIDGTMELYYWTIPVRINTPDAHGNTVEQVFDNKRFVQITGYINYKIDMLTPIGSIFFGKDNLVYKKVYKTRLVRSKYE